MKINDYITYINTPEDVIYLRSKLLPVNMRLFFSSGGYHEIIMYICKYIKYLALSKPDDYKLPHGISGANLAIPFNIIGVVINRGKDNAYCKIMINPEITEVGNEIVEKQSNCGSIRLEKSITVKRYNRVKVHYYDEAGKENTDWFIQNGATIQHEIDHNNGILITDY